MALQLQQLSQEFRKSQKQYLSRLEQQKTNTPGFEDFPGEQDTGFTDAQQMELETHIEDIDSRDQEIQKIGKLFFSCVRCWDMYMWTARSIEELSTIFKELAVHVIDQVPHIHKYWSTGIQQKSRKLFAICGGRQWYIVSQQLGNFLNVTNGYKRHKHARYSGPTRALKRQTCQDHWNMLIP